MTNKNLKKATNVAIFVLTAALLTGCVGSSLKNTDNDPAKTASEAIQAEEETKPVSDVEATDHSSSGNDLKDTAKPLLKSSNQPVNQVASDDDAADPVSSDNNSSDTEQAEEEPEEDAEDQAEEEAEKTASEPSYQDEPETRETAEVTTAQPAETSITTTAAETSAAAAKTSTAAAKTSTAAETAAAAPAEESSVSETTTTAAETSEEAAEAETTATEAETTATEAETGGYYDYNAAYEVVTYVNQLRASLGLSELTWNSEYASIADVRAAELVTLSSHERPGGGYACDMITSGWTSWGENIAGGYGTAQSVYEGWYNSPGHYANMVSSDFSWIGVSCYVDENGYRYWVQEFGG